MTWTEKKQPCFILSSTTIMLHLFLSIFKSPRRDSHYFFQVEWILKTSLEKHCLNSFYQVINILFYHFKDRHSSEVGTYESQREMIMVLSWLILGACVMLDYVSVTRKSTGDSALIMVILREASLHSQDFFGGGDELAHLVRAWCW